MTALTRREELRELLRSALTVPDTADDERTAYVDAITEELGAEVQAIVRERYSGDFLALVQHVDGVYDTPIEVATARWLPPMHHLLRVRLPSGKARNVHVYVMELDALERQAAGHAWDLAALGMLLRGADLWYAFSPVIEERLADCHLGALRFIGRLSLDRQPAVFDLGDFARSALALSLGQTQLEPGKDAADLYRRERETYDAHLGPVLEMIANGTRDAWQREDGYWMWSDDRRRKWQRSSYAWLFLQVARLRAAVRTPQLGAALLRLTSRMGAR